MLTVDVAGDLASLVRLGVAELRVARNAEHEPTLDEPLAAAARDAQHSDSADIATARALYRAIRLDPTRTRPSSEALLRRVRRGEGVPRVNTLVDVGNWCSLEFQLPYGVYDAETICPPIRLRLGTPGESYAGIRKDQIHLDGRFALFDERGPFGNPSADSARTAVTPVTRHALVVVYGPASVDAARMRHVLDVTIERMIAAAGGDVVGAEVR